MTKAGFGEHLKREREMRAVSLDEICAATRISVRFLEALENEEWDRLPGGVFNRGFVRAVARFLGLDEENLVAEYATAVQDRTPPPTWTHQSAPPPAPARWLAWVGTAAVVLVLLATCWLGWRWYARHRAHRNSSASAEYTPGAPPAGGDTGAPTTAAAPGTDSSSGSPSGTSSAATPAGDGLELKIEAGKATTLEVSADGTSAFSGPIIAGQSRSFSAHDRFDVSARDGGALLLQLNGKTLAPIGPPGQPGKVILTHRDAPTPAGGPD